MFHYINFLDCSLCRCDVSVIPGYSAAGQPMHCLFCSLNFYCQHEFVVSYGFNGSTFTADDAFVISVCAHGQSCTVLVF